MTHDDFIALVKALRELGATEVSAGGYSVRFERAVVAAMPKPAPSAPVERGIAPEPDQRTERALWRSKVLARVGGGDGQD
jgi:hypothetical protein